MKDPDELGVVGVEICVYQLDPPPDNVGELARCTLTGPEGNYSFINLEPDFYRIAETFKEGSVQTFPLGGQSHFVTLEKNGVLEDLDFGNTGRAPGQIHGTKFNDLNRDGVWDPGEPGVENVLICISPFGECHTTDGNGAYSFIVPPGNYIVSERVPRFLTNTTPINVSVDVESGEKVVDINFGNTNPLAPPEEVVVEGGSSREYNGIPLVFYSIPTTYTKDVSGHCGGNTPVEIRLVIAFAQSNGARSQMMTHTGPGSTWSATFDPFRPAHGMANLTFYVDCEEDTENFPDDLSDADGDSLPDSMHGEDEIQIGGSIYIDPSGTILSSCTAQPLAGATATLLVESPPNTGNFVSAESGYIPDVNPQITIDDGAYGWVVITGTYVVRAELAGYVTAESGQMDIPPAVTDLDILLTPVGGCPDVTAPVVTLTTPASGASYGHNEVVLADYGCTDETGGSGLLSCVGNVADAAAIETASLGSKSFTVTGTDNAGNSAFVAYNYEVVDVTPPVVTLTIPASGATYSHNEVVLAEYSCTDETGGSGLLSCAGNVANGAAIDTASLGNKSFTVTATDNANNSDFVTYNYELVDVTAPLVTLTTSVSGATYSHNQVVSADYGCTDETGGSGLLSCAGNVADGAAIDTASLGNKSFTVTGTDNAGNSDFVTYNYEVVDVTAPVVILATPASGASYGHNEVVLADYNCTDETGGSGLLSCVGNVADGAAIDTATLGNKSFTVTGTDNAGNSDFVTYNYEVVDLTAPVVTLTTPADGATYIHNEVVLADYSCTDETGGSGLLSCAGNVANGAAIDTASLGPKSFTVTGTDNANNSDFVTYNYEVVRLEVQIDIKPGDDPNSINLSSKGVISVGVFSGTYEGVVFDASTIIGSSLIFERAAIAHNDSHVEDLDGIGALDSISHYRTQLTGGFSVTSLKWCLIGETLGGILFTGCDSIQVVPPENSNAGGGGSSAANAGGNGNGGGKK